VRALPRPGLLALSSLVLTATACGGDGGGSTVDAGPPADAYDPTCRYRTDADQPTPAPISTPRWAFRPWISKDISTDADTRAFVAGFAERGIPVGAVVLDSPWETHYNTFVPDPARYPGFDQLVSDLHGQGIKLVLWTTAMVNSSGIDLEEGGNRYPGPSPNFQRGKDCGFYVNEATEYLWWKGTGASLDFSDPDAIAWWHRQQDLVLDLGIDGWKLDFGEQYVTDVPIRTDGGEVDLQTYGEAYYRDFYAYGRSKRGPEFVTMVRPYDASYGFAGRTYARPEHAPVTWVGDNRRDWVGMIDALDHIFRSVQAGYPMVGADIGGYLDKDDEDFTTDIPFDTLVFARWTALAALTPFMQLHGRANIAPWTVPDHADEVVAAYRFWATLHDELVPFFHSLVAEAHAGGPMPIRPIGASRAEWEANGWRYFLGDAFLVAPITAPEATGFTLPEGAWWSWYSRQAPPAPGGTQMPPLVRPTNYAGYPLFVKRGAIIPLNVTSDAHEHGSAASAGALTVLLLPDTTERSFKVHDDDGATTTLAVRGDALTARVTASRVTQRMIFVIRTEGERDDGFTVTVNGTSIAGLPRNPGPAHVVIPEATVDTWYWDPGGLAFWVRVGPTDGPLTVEVTRDPVSGVQR
jgi:alpha-glucosidase (family GH31 glycosyl hydrolase)